MEAIVASLTPERIDQAVVVLQHAFMPDPIFSHFFPESSGRAAVFRAFFNAIVRSHIRFGHVYGAAVDGTLAGAAIWRPPYAGEPSVEDRVTWQEADQRVRDINPVAAEALFAGFARTEAAHPSVPHWYLFFVGIEPAQQGKGIGKQLLTPVFQAADATGDPCYLETPFRRTHAFYRSLGFEINAAGHPFEAAPTLWTMLRQGH